MTVSFSNNAISNLAAGALPALASLLTIPLIVNGLGTESFGLLTLITSIVGYFSLIDVNVTAGSVKHISEAHKLGDESKLREVFSFGFMTYLVIGAVGGTALCLLSGWLPAAVFNIEPASQALATLCLQVASVGFLLGQVQAYLQSVPQALLRYDVSGRQEVLFGILIPMSAVVLIYLGYGLVEVVVARVGLSLLNCALLWVQIKRLLPTLRLSRPARSVVVSVSSFSGYSFLARVASLSYNHADKLIIGAAIGMAPLAYYAVAATVGNRILGLMYRISAIIFPASSALAAAGELHKLNSLYLRLCRYVSFINASALLVVAGVAEPLLRHWIGEEFAREGALVLQLVAVAQFIDSLTNIPSLVNDALGHPKVTGLFAVSRAILGLVLVFLMVHLAGVQGAAFAHLISGLIITTVFLVYVHGRTVPCALRQLWGEGYLRAVLLLLMGAPLLYGLVHLFGQHPYILLGSLLVLVLAWGWLLLNQVLAPEDLMKLKTMSRNLLAGSKP